MITKNIQYINRDFNSFKSKLIDFSKTYYPNTYNDFSESSPGMMLIEMASYVGDVLSLYQDNQIQETFPQLSKQRKNLLCHSYIHGYSPKVTTPSTVMIDVYQIVPVINVGGLISPDYNYSLNIDYGSQLQTTQNNLKFIIEDRIDFSVSGSNDPTDITVYSVNNQQEPEYYLLKKSRKAYSADIKTISINAGDFKRFKTININDDKIIKILDIKDSDNNTWYEVPYLSQDIIFEKIKNENQTTPYILKSFTTNRRFTSRFKNNTNLEIQFGSGNINVVDEEIIPNSENVGLGLDYGVNKLYTAFDPSNFLYTGAYGISPHNITLNIRYLVGGGTDSNIPSNTINRLNSGNVTFNNPVDPGISNTIINSLSFNNELPSVGGSNGDSNDDLIMKIQSTFPTQLRAVTPDDYIIRSLSMPSSYGTISKAHIEKDTIGSNALSIYILSKNQENALEIANLDIKNNLSTYINEYKSINDSLNIKNAYIINIGVDFDITIKTNYNNRLVINSCLEKLIKYFNIDRWVINQPIILSEIYNMLDSVDGVQTVRKVNIVNKSDVTSGYSKYSYDITAATNNGVIYPSLNPSIFEVKYTNDIKGRSVSF